MNYNVLKNIREREKSNRENINGCFENHSLDCSYSCMCGADCPGNGAIYEIKHP